MKRHYIFTPFGSAGDVHPFLWIGRLLQERGHTVTLIGAHAFTDVARRANVPFVPVGEPGFYERVTQDPNLWHPWHGMRLTLGFAGRIAEAYYRTICTVQEQARADVTLVGTALAFGARIARERLRVPLATIHLQPTMLLSLHDTPVVRAHMEWLPRAPRWLKRVLFSLPNPLDQHAGRLVREACARAGVTAPRSLAWEWMHSPDAVVCLFPRWFAAPQPDWPARCHQAGFPLYDLSDVHALSPELDRFLTEGPAPVVFTAGTAMAHGRNFFAAGLEACRRLGLRAVLATAHRDQLPSQIPDTALAVSYAPFSRLLPRAAALVHHGGVGTLSQALAAGVPQLLMPMAHDQPDNAHRLVQLGVARRLYPKQFTAENVTAALKKLLHDPAVRTACADLAAEIHSDRPADTVIAALESVQFQGDPASTLPQRRRGRS